MPTPRWGTGYPFLILISLTAFCSHSCTTLHVPVQPPAFAPGDPEAVEVSGIEIRAKAIEGRDTYLSLFEDDLPEIGIVAIWVSVRNGSPLALPATGFRWELRHGSSTFHSLSTRKVFDLYYRARRIRAYSAHSDSEARRGMEKLSFPEGILPQSAAREGFVFFKVPLGWSAGWVQGTVLDVRLPKRGESSKESTGIPLSHADR